ncbi:MAG: FliM/FliN family flagellar motor switch protein [Candidatus Latescibacterota bacterium]|nr:FliM/FliN family flagellar motor switch protein [Candidatus Latescibacterota bacterium]
MAEEEDAQAAEEEDAQESDVESEMLRVMQEELDEDDQDTAPAAESDAAGGGGDVGSLLEEEMLKAMEQEADSDVGGGSGLTGGLTSSVGGLPAANYPKEIEGIDKLSDVEVEITVELGDSLVPIQDIMSWASGSVVELQTAEEEPVRVMLNGSPFATGEVVVVGDTFGVRIVELLDSTGDTSG